MGRNEMNDVKYKMDVDKTVMNVATENVHCQPVIVLPLLDSKNVSPPNSDVLVALIIAFQGSGFPDYQFSFSLSFKVLVCVSVNSN